MHSPKPTQKPASSQGKCTFIPNNKRIYIQMSKLFPGSRNIFGFRAFPECNGKQNTIGKWEPTAVCKPFDSPF